MSKQAGWGVMASHRRFESDLNLAVLFSIEYFFPSLVSNVAHPFGL